MDARGTLQVITAMVPLAEISTYSTELRSITGGEGSFSMTQDHYDVVPGNIAEGIFAKAKKAAEGS
jgi:elongation factor G